MQIESVIKNVVGHGETCAGTVVIQAFEGSRTRVTVEVEVEYDPTNGSIRAVKKDAMKTAISACENFVSGLKDKE